MVVGKDGKFVKPCHEIPASCDISCNEDSSGDGEWVHESNLHWYDVPLLGMPVIKTKADDLTAITRSRGEMGRGMFGLHSSPQKVAMGGTKPHL